MGKRSAVTEHPDGGVASDESQPLVSVVTPVYNGERYLAECIESVLAQTYPNWRYLIADNCSTDGTAEIAESYAARDPRIRVHRFTTFETVIRNWNRALTLLERESAFCKFVLADDWLYPECLELMVSLAARHPSVGIVGAYRIKGTEVDLDLIPPEVEVVPGRDVCRDQLTGGKYLLGSPTSLLLRADLVRAREPEFLYEARLDGRDDGFVNYHADTDSFLALLEKTDFGFVHQVLSFTRMHDASITTAWTTNRGTARPGQLLTLLRYGPTILQRDEFEARVKYLQRRYESLLLRSAIRGRFRDPGFRAYHHAAIARIRSHSKTAGVRTGRLLAVLAAVMRIPTIGHEPG